MDIHGSHFSGGTAWSDGGALEFVESTGHVYDNIMEYNIVRSLGFFVCFYYIYIYICIVGAGMIGASDRPRLTL